MDAVHDLPPAARSSHDHLQVLAGTLTALAASLDRLSYQRERSAVAADRQLGEARRELREAQRHRPFAAAGIAPRQRGIDRRPQPAHAAQAAQTSRPPTSGPAQEEALVVAGHYLRHPKHGVAGRSERSADARGDCVDAAVQPWLTRALQCERDAPRWAEPGAGHTPAWASEQHAAARAERHRRRVAAWSAQAEALASDPANSVAADVSRRRAYESLVLAAYWQEKADRLAAVGPAYRPDDRYLVAALEAMSAIQAEVAVTEDDLARRDQRTAVTAAGTPDRTDTPGVDEHQEGVETAAADAGRASGERRRAATADAEGAAAADAARVLRSRFTTAGTNSGAPSVTSTPRSLNRAARCPRTTR